MVFNTQACEIRERFFQDSSVQASTAKLNPYCSAPNGVTPFTQRTLDCRGNSIREEAEVQRGREASLRTLAKQARRPSHKSIHHATADELLMPRQFVPVTPAANSANNRPAAWRSRNIEHLARSPLSRPIPPASRRSSRFLTPGKGLTSAAVQPM